MIRHLCYLLLVAIGIPRPVLSCDCQAAKPACAYLPADAIFLGRVTFTNDDLKKWAKDLGYDISSCLDSNKYQSEIAKDQQDGAAAGVQGTPSFFVGASSSGPINGKLIEGAVPYAQFKQAIDAELAAQ